MQKSKYLFFIFTYFSVDGAPAMKGGQRGFRGFVRKENLSIEVDHCAIHLYSLGCKTLPASLKAVLTMLLES